MVGPRISHPLKKETDLAPPTTRRGQAKQQFSNSLYQLPSPCSHVGDQSLSQDGDRTGSTPEKHKVNTNIHNFGPGPSKH